MAHTVVIFEPDKLPLFIANVRSLRPYKNNPNAVIDPTNLPQDSLEYWKRAGGRRLATVTKAAERQTIAAAVANIKQQHLATE